MSRSRPALGRIAVVAVPYVWLAIFFLAPFAIVFKISLSQTAIAMPPYVPIFDPIAEGLAATWQRLSEFSFANYQRLIGDLKGAPLLLVALYGVAVAAVAAALARVVEALVDAVPRSFGSLVVLVAALPAIAVAAGRLLPSIGLIAGEPGLGALLAAAGVAEPPAWLTSDFGIFGLAVAVSLPFAYLGARLEARALTFVLLAGIAMSERISVLGLLDGAGIYLEAYLTSLWIAGSATFMTLLVGYPIAYGMARAPKSMRPTLLMLVILPFWTSFLIRVYAWIGILSNEGLLNSLLMWAGVIDEPLIILSTSKAVYLGIVYSYLPFMVLPLYSALEKLDDTLLEAAQDLGCTPFQAFWRVTFPLSLPGVVAGSALVFIPAVGEFVIPDLLGGSDVQMIGKTLWEEFFANRDWPVASAVAIALLIILVVPIVFFQNAQARSQEAGR